jgi:hypothetical protein
VQVHRKTLEESPAENGITVRKASSIFCTEMKLLYFYVRVVDVISDYGVSLRMTSPGLYLTSVVSMSM